MYFVVLEAETGNKDGGYTHRAWAESARMNWDRRRPGYEHVVIEANDCYIPNHKFLATVHHR